MINCTYKKCEYIQKHVKRKCEDMRGNIFRQKNVIDCLNSKEKTCSGKGHD